jgi:hypothetical protein
MGVRRFRLADPETFSSENLNRQAGCDTTTLGMRKAEVIAATILRINPRAEVTIENTGICIENVNQFVLGASLVLDETEYSLHTLSIMLGRAARENDVSVVTGLNIGFGSLVTSFTQRSVTIDQYLGIPEDAPLGAVGSVDVPLWRWTPRLPVYIDVDAFARLTQGDVPAPSVAPGVALAAGAIATESFNHLTGRRRPVTAPQALWFDLLQRRMKRVRFPTVVLRYVAVSGVDKD